MIKYKYFIMLAFSALTSTAFAVDGVVEINHTCATHTGCFSGDTVAGYPVTIDGTAGKSYRLTSDLVIPDNNTTGISITSSFITIDLNGFAIIGAACVGVDADCTPTVGSGHGVIAGASNSVYVGITVKNGSVIGMGLDGIQLRAKYAKVINTIIQYNPRFGIWTGSYSQMIHNTVNNNRSTGIYGGNVSTITGNISFNNGGYGIFSGGGSVITGNTSNGNESSGIYGIDRSIITGNISGFNTADGIRGGSGSLVKENTVGDNAEWGLNLATESSYRENVISNNTLGNVSNGVNTGYNLCDGVICP